MTAEFRRRTFLTAEWRYLVMLNYTVEPGLLEPLVPRGTELDAWQGRTFVSVVGFLFRNTRLVGIPIPGHRHFEEVNLRFYVRRRVPNEVRRGVTFVRELVPRRAIAWVARFAYNEPYRRLPMRHRIQPGEADPASPRSVEYAWRVGGEWSRVAVEPEGHPRVIAPGSEEEFVTEHYWGYTRQRDGSAVEYEVRHPRWEVWHVRRAELAGDLEEIYGPAFASVLRREPSSAFLAAGSAVSVHAPSRLSF